MSTASTCRASATSSARSPGGAGAAAGSTRWRCAARSCNSSVSGLCITKLDVLDGLDTIRICVGYRINGTVTPGAAAVAWTATPTSSRCTRSCPAGANRPSASRSYEELPANARRYLERLQALVDVPIDIISTGPDREQTIVLRHPFGARADHTGGRASAPALLLALAALMLLACVLAAGCWRVYSNTWDEPEHLAAGLELLDRGTYEYDTEHPPLARVLLALGPYLAGAHAFGTPPPDGTHEGIDILYAGGHYWRFLTLARLACCRFWCCCCWATWLWARRLFVLPAALLAVLLLVSVPPVLGNAALASLDVAAAATILLALYTLERWLVSAAARDALLFGLATGIAVATNSRRFPSSVCRS